jgi:hypothetical protein
MNIEEELEAYVQELESQVHPEQQQRGLAWVKGNVRLIDGLNNSEPGSPDYDYYDLKSFEHQAYATYL